MKPSSLSLERLEFAKVSVTANPDYTPSGTNAFPQLLFDFKGVNISRRARLKYAADESDDPKHFFCMFGIKIALEDQPERELPYEIDVEVSALVTYLDDTLRGADRFRAVRFSAYQMLYGSVREMVSTITARSRFGLWQLPSADFRQAAKLDAENDEKRRQEKLLSIKSPMTVEVLDAPANAEASAPPEAKASPSSPRKRKAGRKLGV
jgi:hypothetical protein